MEQQTTKQTGPLQSVYSAVICLCQPLLTMGRMIQWSRRSQTTPPHRTPSASNRQRLIRALVAALFLWVPSAYAQTASSTGLEGRVTDPTDAVLAGVTVTVQNIDTGSERIVTTGQTLDPLVEITSGLKSDERVATENVTQLVDGIKVK